MEGVFTAIERAALPKRASYSDFAATPATISKVTAHPSRPLRRAFLYDE
jgi:hypothetical protein